MPWFLKTYKHYQFLLALQLLVPFSYLHAQQIKLPNCDAVKIIHFDIDQILNFEDRFLYEGSIDTIESLYCYAKRTNNLEVEAISLFKLASEYREIFNTPNDFLQAIMYLNACIDLSQQHNLLTPLFWAKEKMCTIFTTNKMYEQAYVFAEDLIDLGKKMGTPQRLAEAYMLLGRLQREQGQYEIADSSLHLSLRYYEVGDSPSFRGKSYAYLHLSNLKRLEKKYTKSIEYAKKGLGQIKELYTHKGGVESYLAMELILSYVEVGAYQKATEALKLISNNTRFEEWVEIQKYIIKAIILEKEGKIDEAIIELFEAKELSIKEKTNVLTLQVSKRLLELYKTKSEVSQHTYDLYNDITKAYDEILEQNTQGNLFKGTYYKLKSEEDNSESLQLRLTNSNYLLFFLFGILLFFSIVSILLFKQMKFKKVFYTKLAKLNTELKNNNSDLIKSNIEIEKRKDELLLELKHQLLILSSQNNMVWRLRQTIETTDGVSISLRKQILGILKFERNKDIIEEINLKFIELNGDLLSKLSVDFPQLTSNDLKLCIYLSMNLSTKEIAQIQFKSTESVKVARSRLRKKLSIDHSSIKLSAFLNSYRK